MAEERAPQQLAQDRIDAAQARRKAQQASEAAAKLQQAAADIEAIADLEASEGFDRVIAIELGAVWKPGVGAPTRIAVVVPLGDDGSAACFIETINKYKEGSKQRLDAQNALANDCWRYPEKGSPAYKAALNIAPLILSNAALQIVRAAQGQAQEAGKD